MQQRREQARGVEEIQITEEGEFKLVPLWAFNCWSIARDLALIVVAIISNICEARTVGDGVEGPIEVTLVEPAVEVGLIQFTDSIGDIVQLGDNSVLDFAQTDDEADHEQGGDEDEFCADDKASFVVQELTNHC